MRKKTPRVFTPVENMAHFITKLNEHGDRIAYRFFDDNHQVKDMTYSQLSSIFSDLTVGFVKTGFSGKRIAVIGETSVEWVASYVAAIACGGVAVPMDKELEPSVIAGFIDFAGIDAVVYSVKLDGAIAQIKQAVPQSVTFIPMTAVEGVLSLPDLMKNGEGNALDASLCENVNAMSEMLFTSGTTGTSKCVMLSQNNVFSAVNSACATVEFSCDDVIVSVLPIHHTYELCIMLAALNYGMTVCINDSVKRVLRNFALFKPTGLVLVPLYVTTMNKKVWDEARKNNQEKTLKVLIKVSNCLRHLSIDLRRIFFKKVLDAFGGRLNKIICGGAALNTEVSNVFSSFGIDIYEGYGITECSPLIAVAPYFNPKTGSVGPAVPACQVRLEVEQKNDLGFDEGEILVKGDNVMLGYYKNDAETKAVFTEDGWFRTGDIGYIDRDGYIYITGRKKNVIIFENGKNVYPEELEEYLNNLESVCESAVIARKNEEGQSEITALIYPEMSLFEGVSKDEMTARIKNDVDALNHRLTTYKQIRQIELRDEPFEKTTSRKIKRFLLK